MPLAKCPRCDRIFNKIDAPVCLSCMPDEDADYETLRKSLEEQPNLTPQEIADATGVSLDCILRLIEAGRLATMPDLQTNVSCGRCGAPAISVTKRLCESCLQKLNSEVAKAQASIKLAQKKKLQIGAGMHIRKWEENY